MQKISVFPNLLRADQPDIRVGLKQFDQFTYCTLPQVASEMAGQSPWETATRKPRKIVGYLQEFPQVERSGEQAKISLVIFLQSLKFGKCPNFRFVKKTFAEQQ
jgi:hypothetical protein